MGTSTDVTVSSNVAKSMHSRGTDGVSRPGTDGTAIGIAFTITAGLEHLLGPLQAVFSVGLTKVAAPGLLTTERELCPHPALSDAMRASRAFATSSGMPRDTTGVRSSCSESTMCAGKTRRSKPSTACSYHTHTSHNRRAMLKNCIALLNNHHRMEAATALDGHILIHWECN